ncbi:MAG: PPOX class F420-dependent oxidoreductase [Ardenticatenaceae bacterium]|nr:PPOX class F420-dependent oxidoreductase [Ardenticatenaceae bacterium]
MSEKIPEDFRDLLVGPVPVTVATLMPDGSPQLSVVWCNYDGKHILINTARGRQKEKNLRRRPEVSVLAIDPENPYRYLEVRGTVQLTQEGAKDHINELARLYRGMPAYYGYAAPAEREKKETRVIGIITPTHVVARG